MFASVATTLTFGSDHRPVATAPDHADGVANTIDTVRMSRSAMIRETQKILNEAADGRTINSESWSAGRPQQPLGRDLIAFAASVRRDAVAFRDAAADRLGTKVLLASDYGQIDPVVVTADSARSARKSLDDAVQDIVKAARTTCAHHGHIGLVVVISDRPDIPQYTYGFTLIFPQPQKIHAYKGQPAVEWKVRTVYAEVVSHRRLTPDHEYQSLRQGLGKVRLSAETDRKSVANHAPAAEKSGVPVWSGPIIAPDLATYQTQRPSLVPDRSPSR